MTYQNKQAPARGRLAFVLNDLPKVIRLELPALFWELNHIGAPVAPAAGIEFAGGDAGDF